tara:strand:+ start:1022 stop:1654 length:633 start_codon:yes stop_codon:yes gene_type:complete
MKKSLPNIIPIFPLSGVIYFPKTNLPLNIFENRYLKLVNDCMQKNSLMGMVQSKKNSKDVYNVGCLGKITDHKKSKDGRILINLTGIIRFQIKSEINNDKLYREFEVDYEKFLHDRELNFFNETNKSNLNLLLEKSKVFFKKFGLLINWNEFKNLDIDQQINTLAMIAPISNEEKQTLLETSEVNGKIKILLEIIEFYLHEKEFSNATLQ